MWVYFRATPVARPGANLERRSREVVIQARFSLVLVCFVLSGFAALLYETAWTRELGFLFGSSELAVAAVLGAYMGGLAFGAAVAARIAHRVTRPVLVYGVLELTIAVSALLMPFALQGVTAIYVAIFGGAPAPPAQGQLWATAFQFGSAFLLLLIPTSCMGATLPLLARYCVEEDAQVGPRIGALYSTNVLGAIAGVVLAGFVFLPELGLRRTVWIGAATNALVFVFAALLARGVAASGVKPLPARRADFSWVLPVICLSGATSFAYEILWMRLLSHMLGGSIYAFATMLATFLAGIALGGALASPLARTRARATLGLIVAQFCVGGSALAAFALANRLPELAKAVGAVGPEALQGSALLSACVMMPMATAIGATFPFAIRVSAGGPDEAASASARVTAWNTVGSIAGSLGTALFLLPMLLFAGTAQVAAGLNFGLAALASFMSGRRMLGSLALVAVIAVLVFPPAPPWAVLKTSALGGKTPWRNSPTSFFRVGRSSTVLLVRRPSGYRLLTNGLPESMIRQPGLPPHPAPAASWMSMLPTMLRPEARSMLVIGLGGGTVLETVPSAIEKIDVIELEEEVLAANQFAAAGRARDPLSDPRVTVYVNDARGALALSEQTYDAVVAQASHPWTAGASHLYTREFFELVKGRLADDGVFVQWMGATFVDMPLLRSLIAGLAEVFPHVNVTSPVPGAFLFVASQAPFDLIANAKRALEQSGDDYAEWGVDSVEDFIAIQSLDDAEVRAFTAGSPVSTDDHNLLAARSARVGHGGVTDATYLEAIAEISSPARFVGQLRPQRLVRRLLSLQKLSQAREFAELLEPGDREIALGWIARAETKPIKASEHFRKAIELGGDAYEAQAGLALTGSEAEGLALDFPAGELAQARSAVAARDWDTLGALDEFLAQFEPGDPFFVDAQRYRAEWRLSHAGDVEMAQAALELADRALRRESGRTLLDLRRRCLQVIRNEEEVPAELIEIPELE
jgi:spermidine synthase